ncbi:hypothetical protein D3C79_518130 [compost metagenome]
MGCERPLELGDPRPLVTVAQGALRLLAIEMGDGLRQLLALEFLQANGDLDGLVPVTQLLMDDEQLRQGRLFKVAVFAQLLPERFGPVQQAGSQEIPGQLLQCELTLLPGQLAGDQVLVDLDGTVHLAPLTKEVAEREMGFDGFTVDFQQLDKEIHRLVRLVRQQIVEARHVLAGKLVTLLLGVLANTPASHVPAITSGNRQQQEKQFKHRGTLFLGWRPG